MDFRRQMYGSTDFVLRSISLSFVRSIADSLTHFFSQAARFKRLFQGVVTANTPDPLSSMYLSCVMMSLADLVGEKEGSRRKSECMALTALHCASALASDPII
jgi:hypothetical protein